MLLLAANTSEASSASSLPASDCLEISFAGCQNTAASPYVVGVYELYTGECPGAISTAPTYYNTLTKFYMYKTSSSWSIHSVCGPMAAKAYGNAGDYPFLDTSTSWMCANTPFIASSVTITCSLYIGQSAPCSSGTFSATGSAPAPHPCSSSCPPHLSYSPRGATSLSQCLTLYNNFYAVSAGSNRATALNADTKQFELIKEGDYIDSPWDIEFITEHLTLISSYDGQHVLIIDSEGNDRGVFAYVTSPVGILHLPHLNLVAIASRSSTYKRVYFFSTDDFNNGTPLEMSDALSITTSTLGADEPLYLCRGEEPDEILITTEDAKVLRMCIPGIPSSSCSAARNQIMVRSGDDFR